MEKYILNVFINRMAQNEFADGSDKLGHEMENLANKLIKNNMNIFEIADEFWAMWDEYIYQKYENNKLK